MVPEGDRLSEVGIGSRRDMRTMTTMEAFIAGVAELADARDLGSRVLNDVQVRFLSPAFEGVGRWKAVRLRKSCRFVPDPAYFAASPAGYLFDTRRCRAMLLGSV